MQCSQKKIWLSDAPDADLRWADHLASCASCRTEASVAAGLRQTMQALPERDAPAEVGNLLQQRLIATEDRRLGCDETLELLEPYREGLLNVTETFLVEDHLLWCASCAEELEMADGLAGAMRALPQLTPPDSIFERVALARLPWWQRLWTTPAPSWSFGRLLQAGSAMAAAALLFAVMINFTGKDRNLTVINHRQPEKYTVLPPSPDENKREVVVGPSVSHVEIAVAGPQIIAASINPPVALVNGPVLHTEAAPIEREIDRTPTPMSKAVSMLAELRPETMIQPRGDSPSEITAASRPSGDPAPRDWDTKPEPPRVVASAREALLKINREATMAGIDQELSSLPDSYVFAAVNTRPEPSRPAGPAPLPVASTDVVSRTLSDELKRNITPPMSAAPISAVSTHSAERSNGVLFVIQ